MVVQTMRLLKPIDDLIFWVQRWYYSEGRYFICLPPDSLHSTAIYEIVRGPCKGLQFCFTTINTETMSFGYHVIKWSDAGATTKKVTKIAKKILLVICWNLYNGYNGLQIGLKPGEEYEDRTSYIEEPDPKRVIRSKSVDASEE
jgi:hypothetical protein